MTLILIQKLSIMPNTSKREHEGIEETIQQVMVNTAQKDEESSIDHIKRFKQARDGFLFTLEKAPVDVFAENSAD